MPVSSKHREYVDNLPQWELTRDAVEGSAVIKSKGTQYLPKPNDWDNSPENTARYDQYILRANYVNFTGQTRSGWLDMVFREDMRVDLPTDLEYLTTNANGSGLTLDQLTRRVVSDLCITGRVFLLVDYPEAPAGLTRAEVQARNLRANILIYPAESAINWRTTTEGGITKLALVVLREPTEVVSADGFDVEWRVYHRVLRYEDGIYTQELYDDSDELIDITEPRKADGSTWNEIPGIFLGAQNNDPTVDKAPLYDVAEVNIAHYRNSADFEESCFLCGQPTPYLSGLSMAWVKEVLKSGIQLGSRTGILLPEGGAAGLLQAASNQMPAEGMDRKEIQLMKIGARIIMDSRGNETENAAMMRFAGQTSPLAVIVGNVESGLKTCFNWCGLFMGADGESVELELNKEFYDRTIDPQLITAQIMLLDRGILAVSDLRNNLRTSGVLASDRTDQDIDGEAEQTI